MKTAKKRHPFLLFLDIIIVILTIALAAAAVAIVLKAIDKKTYPKLYQ